MPKWMPISPLGLSQLAMYICASVLIVSILLPAMPNYVEIARVDCLIPCKKVAPHPTDTNRHRRRHAQRTCTDMGGIRFDGLCDGPWHMPDTWLYPCLNSMAIHMSTHMPKPTLS